MYPRTSVGLPARVIDLFDLFSQLRICLLLSALRPFLPRIITTRRDVERLTEVFDWIGRSQLCDLHVFHSGCPRVSMDKVFCTISRSCCTSANSRRRRRFSSSNGVWCPLPGNACFPCSRATLHQCESTLSEIPNSRATWLILFPLVSTKRMAFCLNSGV